MQLFSTVCDRLSWGGANTPWPLFWKKHWIWPLMVFYIKLNLPSRRIKLATAGLDSRLIDDGKVATFTRWLPFTPRKIPGTHFC
jgi:hypothetical protein